MRQSNPRQWIHRYVVYGDSVAYTEDEVYMQFRLDSEMANLFFEVAPSHQRYWLYGQILPTEFQEYQKHIKKVRAGK